MRTATRIAIALCLALLFALLGGRRVEALRLFYGSGPAAEAGLQLTPRWSVADLADGLDVCVVPGFAQAVGATNQAEIDEVHARVSAAFAAWESPVLRFNVYFGCSAPPILVTTFDDPLSPFYGATFLGDPLFAPGALAPRDCAIDDVVVLRRALQALPPGIARCAGTPVLT